MNNARMFFAIHSPCSCPIVSIKLGIFSQAHNAGHLVPFSEYSFITDDLDGLDLLGLVDLLFDIRV